MNNLSPLIYVVPVIALVITIVEYIILIKQVANKKAFRRLILLILSFSFLLNTAWELIQLPFYKGASYSFQHIIFCSLGALADTIMVLLLYQSFALIYKNPYWAMKMSVQKILILVIMGGIGAILAEVRNVHSGNWAYSNDMPIIPGINVGLYPILQFMILPTCIYYFIMQKKNIY